MPGHATRWQDCGVYDQDTGMFYLREGEYEPIHTHFNLLRLNRLHQKKDKGVEEGAKQTHKPKVLKKSSMLVDRKR